MTVDGSGDISGLFAAWGNGDEQALGRLMDVLYPEMRRIARQHLGRRPAGHTLESAALANEAYLTLELAAFAARIARTFWRSARKSSVEFVDHARSRVCQARVTRCACRWMMCLRGGRAES